MPPDEPSLHQPHDKGYKYLLSSKRAFLELLRSFVPRDWVQQIDEAHLFRPDKSYILQDFKDKEADLVYVLKRSEQDDQPEIIFYVLMELQSTVDYQMPYRLLLYQVEIWRDLLKNIKPQEAARKDFRLPPIVPIVLYNGKAPWTAAQTFRQTLAGEDLFGEELLNFRYILIDVHRMSEPALFQWSNLMGAVFYLDQSDSLADILQRLQTLIGTIQRLSPEQQQLFFTWVTWILGSRLPPSEQKTVEELVTTMKEKGVTGLQTNIERILDEALHQKLEEGMAKGIEKGMAQGIEKGRKEGKRDVARKLLLKGMDIPFIADATDLTEEEIEQLKWELRKQ